MASLFSPIQTLSRLPNSDPQTSRVLLAGLSVVPCAAVAARWQIDTATSGFIGLYTAGLGAAVIAVANILNDEFLRRILGLALVVVLTVVAFAVSAVWRNQPCLNPTYPVVGFWERCDAVEERAVEEKRRPIEVAATIPKKAAVPNGAKFDPGDFSALIPFAGLIVRDDVRRLNQSPVAAGWKVQGTSGETTPSFAGSNDLRYLADASAPAAQAPADAVTATKMSSAPVRIQKVGLVNPAVLEVWILQ